MLHIDRIHSKSVRLWAVNPKSIWSSECLCYILSVVLVIACYIYHEGSNREIRKNGFWAIRVIKRHSYENIADYIRYALQF